MDCLLRLPVHRERITGCAHGIKQAPPSGEICGCLSGTLPHSGETKKNDRILDKILMLSYQHTYTENVYSVSDENRT